MTHEDVLAREGIRDVIARYNIAGDRLRIDDFTACFTHDAILESDRVPANRAFRFVGREAIREWQTQWLDRAASGTPVHEADFVRHHLTTQQIDLVTRDDATARTYWQAWTRIGPDHAGYYLDELRRVNGHWLIAHRRVRMDWESEASLFKPAIERSTGLRGAV